MLTEHQLFHLNAVLSEAEEILNGDNKMMGKLAKVKKVKKGKEDKYYKKIIKDIEDIKKSKKFPDLKRSADIHDYLEKDTKVEFHG